MKTWLLSGEKRIFFVEFNKAHFKWFFMKFFFEVPNSKFFLNLCKDDKIVNGWELFLFRTIKVLSFFNMSWIPGIEMLHTLKMCTFVFYFSVEMSWDEMKYSHSTVIAIELYSSFLSQNKEREKGIKLKKMTQIL